ncbi:MAG: aldehyde dehydrogenase family protein [Bacteroidales bacterium]|nr:aldehyde dehydrogenase family protein [Bacteroidales bacterium]
MVYSSVCDLQFPSYLAGTFTSEGKTLEVHNPFDGTLVGTAYQVTEIQLNEAIEAARAIRYDLQEMPSWKKYEILMAIASRLNNEKEFFARLIASESGKPIKSAFAETERAIQTFRIAAEESRRLPSEYLSLDWARSTETKEGLVKYFPAGIVAGISPFNFPLNLAVHKIAPAIAAGCPIILKPSSLTPLSTLYLAKIIHECDLPAGALSVLPMDRPSGNLLVTDERIKVLSFTGSPEVGWMMKNQAGKKKVVLELGGNAGLIVSQPTDMDDVVKKCVNSAFSYSGQVCIHTQRIFVLSHHFEHFISRFVEEVSALKSGNPLDDATDISVMIDIENAKRVESWIQESVIEGGRLLIGGKRHNSYVEPTVITNTHPDHKVCSEEVFGPVVVIEPIGSLDEGIRRINESRFGLQAGLFTDSLQEINTAFKRIEVGGLIINDVPSYRVDHMPYGGVKDSGFGREGVKYAMYDMLEARILVKPA